MEHLAAEISATITTIHLVGDHARAHHGQQVRAWLTSPPRLVVHFTPGHGSWLNQVAQWFSILQRQRLRITDCASTAARAAKLEQGIAEGNAVAHPFTWTTKSVAKVMADVTSAAA